MTAHGARTQLVGLYTCNCGGWSEAVGGTIICWKCGDEMRRYGERLADPGAFIMNAAVIA